MGGKLLLAIALSIFSLCAAPRVSAQQRARAQAATPQTSTPARQTNSAGASQNSSKDVSIDSADLAITANVTAKELRFEVVPNPTVEFPGKPERDTVWDAVRENLPRPVQPGVTYRNIGIRLKIVSRFADIERIVSEALGETPVTDSVPQETASPQPSPQPPISPSQPNGGRP